MTARRGAILANSALAVLALALTLPFWTRGIVSRHDMLLHVSRLVSLERAVASGDYYPRLAPEAGFGYGYPLFQYYAPLVAYVSLGFVGLGLGYVAATKATFALALVLSATGAGALARRLYARTPAALLSGGAFVLSPYLLLNLYERGSLGESLALGLEPWVLLAFDRALARPRPGRLAAAGAVLSAMLFAHNVTALFFAPVLLAAVFVGVAERRDWRAALGGVVAGVLGILASAIYWLPALLQKDEVGTAGRGGDFFRATRHLAGGLGDVVQRGFVFDYWGPSRFRLGGVQAAVFAVGLCAAAWVLRRQRWRLAWLVVVLVAGVLAQLPSSAGFWERAPLVAFIQFPWRLLGHSSLAGALLAGSLAALFSRPRAAWLVTVVVIALMAGSAVPRLDPSLSRSWEPAFDDARVARLDHLTLADNNTSVDLTTGSFLPTALRLPYTAIPRAASEARVGPTLPLGRVRARSVGRQSIALSVASPLDWELLLARFYYPGWQATVDGRPAKVGPSRDLGLVGIHVPAGEHAVRVWFGQDSLQGAAAALSGVGVIALIVLTIAAVPPRRRPHATAFALAALALMAVVLMRPATEARPSVHEAQLDGVRLIASQIEPHGGGLTLTLFWLALTRPVENYLWQVEAVPLNGAPADVFSGTPGRSMMPTTRWHEGEVVADVRDMLLAPGRHRLYVGLARADGVALAPVAEAGQEIRGARVFVGEVDVPRLGSATPR